MGPINHTIESNCGFGACLSYLVLLSTVSLPVSLSSSLLPLLLLLRLQPSPPPSLLLLLPQHYYQYYYFLQIPGNSASWWDMDHQKPTSICKNCTLFSNIVTTGASDTSSLSMPLFVQKLPWGITTIWQGIDHYSFQTFAQTAFFL